MSWVTYCAEKAHECELRAREERSPRVAAQWRDAAVSWRRAALFRALRPERGWV